MDKEKIQYLKDNLVAVIGKESNVFVGCTKEEKYEISGFGQRLTDPCLIIVNDYDKQVYLPISRFEEWFTPVFKERSAAIETDWRQDYLKNIK